MKLYATTTSERASKGQGGNKFIEIELKAGDYTTPIGYIYLDAHEDGEYVLKWKKQGNEDAEILTQGQLKQKGKQKKDEISAPRRADWIDDGKDDTY